MNFKITFILIFLSFLNLSCKEQDYFKVEDKPEILIENIGQNFISLNITSLDKNQNLQLLISKTDNFESKIDTTKDVILFDSLNYSSLKFNDKSHAIVFNSKLDSSRKIVINNLENLTDYTLALYKSEKGKLILHRKLNFSTVVESPITSSKNLTFADVTDKEMTITFQPGNGEGRIVIARKDSIPEFPTDGIDYIHNVKYGSDSSKIGKNTYCIYKTNISADNKFTVTNLKPGKYYFAVIEYNGNGQHISYLGEFTTNLRAKNTSLSAPLALPAEIIDLNNFVAKWEKHPDAEYFLLDIAEDSEFVNIVFPYEGVDVGDSNIVEIELPFSLDEKNIFYRVRAFANGTITGSSNVIKVVKEKTDSKGK